MFKCNNCDLSFKHLSLYNKHQRRHSVGSIRKISCLYPECKALLKSYASFKQHVFRQHSNRKFCCAYPNCVQKYDSNELLKEHFKTHDTAIDEPQYAKESSHSNGESSHEVFTIEMDTSQNNLSDCDQMKMTHSLELEIEYNNCQTNNENPSSVSGGNNVINNRDDSLFIVMSVNWEIEDFLQESNNKISVSDPTQIFSQIYLQMSVKHLVAEPALQEVVTNMYSAFSMCQNKFKNTVLKSNFNSQQKLEIQTMFDDSLASFSNTHHPNLGFLRNTYQRNNYYKKK